MNIILIINFLLYFILFYYNWKRKKSGWFIAAPIIAVFLISAFCSFFYYDSDLYKILSEKKFKNSLSFTSLIYLFICFYIYIYPLVSYKRFKYIYYPQFGKVDFLFIFFIIVGLISIIPFFESLSYLSKMTVVDMADNYEESRTDVVDIRSYFSPIGRICNGIVSWFQYIMPLGFFYLINKNRKWYWCLFVLMGTLCPMFSSMIRGGRGPLFQVLCIFLFNFIIFYNTFSPKVKKITIRIVLTAIAIIAFILIIMTFSRYEGETNYAIDQIFRYLGEGFVNFAETGWYVTEHSYGKSIFNGTGYTFLKDLLPIFEARDYDVLGNLLHIRMYVYYTVMGDAFLDFGLIGGIVFFILLSYLFMSYTHKTGRFSSLILLNLYAKIGFNGIFCWAYMYRLDFVVFTLLIYIIIRFLEK